MTTSSAKEGEGNRVHNLASAAAVFTHTILISHNFIAEQDGPVGTLTAQSNVCVFSKLSYVFSMGGLCGDMGHYTAQLLVTSTRM